MRVLVGHQLMFWFIGWDPVFFDLLMLGKSGSALLFTFLPSAVLLLFVILMFPAVVLLAVGKEGWLLVQVAVS